MQDVFESSFQNFIQQNHGRNREALIDYLSKLNGLLKGEQYNVLKNEIIEEIRSDFGLK